MIEVNANYFRAAFECQSHNEHIRPYLCGVHITPHPTEGAILTATNGCQLISIYDKDGECSIPRIVSVDRWAIEGRVINRWNRDQRKIKPLKPSALKVVADDAGTVTIGTYRSLGSCFVDGAFPDWHKIVRPVLAGAQKGVYCPSSYDQKFIALFSRIAAMLGAASVRVISFTEEDPTLIRFDGAEHAFGVLMPRRSVVANDFPSWMKSILQPGRAEASA